MNYQIYQCAKDISESNWPAPANNNPLLSKAFFESLESSESATAERGWIANHILSDNLLIPSYIKDHSWGEYVFDHSWANTYQHYGYEYFPKLVSAIPFTPVTSKKILGSDDYATAFACLNDVCEQHNLSSWHMLFCPQQTELPECVYERLGVQFHWFNQNYQSFEEFLSTFVSRKRKNTRKERDSIAQQGVTVKRIIGSEITVQQLDFFYLCYQITYLKRGHQPHLSKRFFETLLGVIADKILLVIAEQDQQPVASALFFHDDTSLYGRYWGCTSEIKNLHFELCYYQGIEFCIEQQLHTFNPGTQGEHKIQRGFTPTYVHSYHWLAEAAFRPAIDAFCKQEQQHMKHYLKQCTEYLPFK